MLISSCTSLISNRSIVRGTEPDVLLKLRAGPGLGYNVILGLPDGTVLYRGECVTETGQLWCQVKISTAPRITGYVSADYLSPKR